MPVDAKEYAGKLSLTNFVNAHCQIRDTMRYQPERVLIVGIGVGLEPLILRHKLHRDVCTLDIDAGFNPDYVGSVHDMRMFSDGQFDVVIASHILEHLPFSYFRDCLSELARVANHAIVYLPWGGKHLEWKFIVSQRRWEYSIRLHLPPWKRVDGEHPDLQAAHHYWECGYPGFSIKTIASIMAEYFCIDDMYHNHDWKYSLNFLLTSRVAKPRQSTRMTEASTTECV
jgi:predicted SAM-dependent methyltransferase